MTATQKYDFISELVMKELNANSAARQAWEVIGYAVPDERYEIYQSTAEEILKSKWQCASIKKHISNTGK